jgi:hypothetical protein
MLEKLDQVEWSKLSHAYGFADDVPALIRDLASSNPKVRQNAMHELYGNIWHQGTVYEATAYAVPFLAELLNSDKVTDKNQILLFLSALANGHSYLDVHQHLPLFKSAVAEKTTTAQWEAQLAQELEWVKKAAEAVKLEIAVYLRLLADDDSLVRDAAANLLASLGGPEPRTAREIKDRLTAERDQTVRASLLLSLGAVCKPESEEHQTIVDLSENDPSSSVRLAGALSLLRVSPDRIPGHALHTIMDSIENPDAYSAIEKSCWAEGEIVAFVSNYLGLLPPEDSEAVQDLLEKALPLQKPFQSIPVVETLLRLAFRGPISPGTLFSGLDGRQRRVLQCLAENRHFWGVPIGKTFAENANSSMLMRSYNLPDRLNKLEAYLRGE